MWMLVAGLIVFFAPHLTRMLVPGMRDAAMARLGEAGWKGIYTLTSLAGLLLIIFGWRMFRPDAAIIYDPPAWGRHVTELAMLIALILMSAANMPAGRIRAILQHPFMIAIIIWSAGHLLANGDQSSLLLFGAFLVYGVWNLLVVTRRDVPRVEFVSYRGDIGAIAIGIILTGIIAMWLHGWIAGVSLF